MKHIKYEEEMHLFHEEFARESYKGCQALRTIQRNLSAALNVHVHLSDIALAYEDFSQPAPIGHERADILNKIKVIFLDDSSYKTILDQARLAVYHSNSHSGLHGCE